MVAAAESILDDLKKNPKNIRAARQFLNYYLDATIKIVTRYAELARRTLPPPISRSRCERWNPCSTRSGRPSRSSMPGSCEDDVLDLDAEMSLL